MRSNIISFAGLTALATLFSSVSADNWWYAIYQEADNNFLDSNNALIQTTAETGGLEGVKSNSDKGERYNFRQGLNKDGFVSSSAHADHIIGYDSSANEFHADFKQSNTGSAVSVHFLNDTHLTLCFNNNCIGPGGAKVDTPTAWRYDQVNEA